MIRTSRLLAPFLACIWLSGCSLSPAAPGTVLPEITDQETKTATPVILQESPIPPITPTPTTRLPTAPSAQEIPMVAATPTVPPTTTLHLEPASSENPPSFPADFVYLLDGNLSRWDTRAEAAEVFLELDDRSEIVNYTMDASQRWMAVLIDRGITASGVELFDIFLIDLERGTLLRHAEDLRRSDNLQLSPDGGWLLYQGGEQAGQIYILQTTVGSSPIKIGDCTWNTGQSCEPPQWSPDSRKLVWSDEEGIWLYELGATEPVVILSSTLEEIGTSGESQRIEADYYGLDWSSEGRYVLLRVRPRRIDANWMAILDSKTGRIAEVPNTYGWDDPSGRITWLEDGTLLVATGGENSENDPMRLVFMEVLPAHKDMLVLTKSLSLDDLSAPGDEQGATGQRVAGISFLTAADPRKVCMVLQSYAEDTPPALQCLDLKYQTLERLVEAPHDIQSLTISPNVEGLIITGSHGSTLYASGDGSEYLDILSLLGGTPGKIDWIKRLSINSPTP